MSDIPSRIQNVLPYISYTTFVALSKEDIKSVPTIQWNKLYGFNSLLSK